MTCPRSLSSPTILRAIYFTYQFSTSVWLCLWASKIDLVFLLSLFGSLKRTSASKFPRLSSPLFMSTWAGWVHSPYLDLQKARSTQSSLHPLHSRSPCSCHSGVPLPPFPEVPVFISILAVARQSQACSALPAACLWLLTNLPHLHFHLVLTHSPTFCNQQHTHTHILPKSSFTLGNKDPNP